MKRSEIVNQLMNEGFSEKTLAQLSDKQLNGLAERILGEQVTPMPPKQPALKIGPKGGELPPSPKGYTISQNPTDKSIIAVAKESEVSEELKGNQKKIDKNHNGKIDAQDFKILKGQKKKGDVNELLRFYDDDGNPIKNKKGEQDAVSTKDKDFEKKVKTKKSEKNKEDKKSSSEVSEVKTWIKGLVENEKFHSFTSKNEIMDLIQAKLNEGEKHEYGPNVKTGHNGLPEFMTYDAIKSSAPTTKPAPTKPKVDPGTKPKTPYQPGPGKNPKPKAGLRNLPENEVTELDHQELTTSDRFEKLRTALAKNTNVSVAYVKKDGTVRHMLVKRFMSSYVPSDREKSEKQMNINQNHDVKRVIDVNAYIKGLRETNGDKELAAKKAWRTINLRDVLGFMVKGEFIDLRDENEIQQRFGDDVNNSLTKSMVNAMQAEENNAEMEVA